jgi:hypothetical protein
MKRKNELENNTPKELANSLGLDPLDSIEWEVRNVITKKIIKCFQNGLFTVTDIAERAGTSRGRITKILKHETIGISLDVLVRVLGAMGESMKISFKKVA